MRYKKVKKLSDCQSGIQDSKISIHFPVDKHPNQAAQMISTENYG